MRPLIAFLLTCCCIRGAAQAGTSADSIDVPFSENGWYLSPHGTIRILVIFAEIDYDKEPAKDPQPTPTPLWPKGQLPTWKDDLFDPFPLAEPKAMVTRYYHDVSLGDFVVLGDYLDRVVTITQSACKNLNDWSTCAWSAANAQGGFHTAHGLSIDDLDHWHDGGKPGLPKVPGPDDPHSYDHVMVILRNSGLQHGQGSTDAGSSGTLFGFPSDTQSRFGAMNGLPFEILKHEFNHLLLGGNNFHSGGGNAAQFAGYFLPMQGGWSMMGAASSSLLTASAWDRDRLGWRAKDAQHRINARNISNGSVSSDLDPLAGDTGVFVLRDFVTTGDALRIRLPFIPSDEYQQWLWVENHQTYARNGSPTDRFHWESTNNPCVAAAAPGLFMTLQVDRENKRGKDIYGGNADYLHPLTASGHFDLETTTDTLNGTCPFGGRTMAFRRLRENPLTGSCEQEVVVFDRNQDGALERSEHFVPTVLQRPGAAPNDSPRFFGRPEHAFRIGGSQVLNMASNPSSASMLTLVSAGKRENNKGRTPDNRTVYLNGIRLELVEQRADGAIVVRVGTGDTRMENDVIWCADSIVLPPLHGTQGRALTMARGKRMRIDRSLTPTRMAGQGEAGGRRYFSPPTRFTISTGASVLFEAGSKLQLATGSVLHLMPGAELTLDPSATLSIDAGSRLVVHPQARLVAKAKLLRKLQKRGRLVEL